MGIINENIKLAKELSRYSRLCYDRRLVGAAGGNLSVRVPGRDVFLVTASGVALRDVAPENIVAVDGDCAVLDNPAGLKPSKEISFHLSIYNTRPEVNAVVHVHPTYATVFAAQRKQIPLVTVSSKLKLKQGRIVPEANPGSQALCDYVASAVRAASDEVDVLLMERHGVVVYGKDLCAAYDAAELTEDTAKIAYLGGEAIPHGRVIDLTASLDNTIHIYPTDPPYRKSWHVEFDQVGMYVSKLEIGAHAGTHVDAPLHYLKDGYDVASTPIERFFGRAVAIDAPKLPGENIAPSDFVDADIRDGDIVLFRTGWEERANSPRFFEGEWPGFTEEAVEVLIGKRVAAIGGDIASADSPTAIGAGAPAHKMALAAGLPIFEALVNMREVTGKRFFFVGLPLRIDRGEGSPIRAIAILEE